MLLIIYSIGYILKCLNVRILRQAQDERSEKPIVVSLSNHTIGKFLKKSIIFMFIPVYTQCASNLESITPLSESFKQSKQAITNRATIIITRYNALSIENKHEYIAAVVRLHQQAQICLIKLEAFERIAATALQQPIINLIGNVQQQVLEDTVLSTVQQTLHQDISHRVGADLLPLTDAAEDSIQSINQTMGYQPHQCLDALQKTIAMMTAHSLLSQSFSEKK